MRAVLGGSFNPPHFAHIYMASEALRLLPVEEVLWVPTHQPPHKEHPDISAQHRLAMVELCCAEDMAFIPDPIELEREGPSYTLDTLMQLEATGRGPICWLMGVDMLATFSDWNRPQEILENAALAVFPRRINSEEQQTLRLPEWLISKIKPQEEGMSLAPGEIVLLNSAPPAVSSTEIRAMAREGQDYSGWVTPAVHDYIRTTGLYRS